MGSGQPHRTALVFVPLFPLSEGDKTRNFEANNHTSCRVPVRVGLLLGRAFGRRALAWGAEKMPEIGYQV